MPDIYFVNGGTGSGKGTVCEIIKDKYGKDGAVSFSASLILRRIFNARGEPENREMYKEVSRIGPQKYTQLLKEEIDKHLAEGKAVILDGQREPISYKILKEKFPEAINIFVDAPEEIRRDRMKRRKRDIDKELTDEGINQIFRLENGEGDGLMNLPEIRKNCDILIENDYDLDEGQELHELREHVLQELHNFREGEPDEFNSQYGPENSLPRS